ncbi:hypothetical protein EJB05_54902 [Eragrostis curvula]|uniref:Myb-like domain-containing protein n=1 Tax=Eragrostis curvula TaxID=38414 RepID=A0A5J9SLB5_9POAL|nr:hypothetical protein EJB05_54902 [Eragrostis curvula]
MGGGVATAPIRVSLAADLGPSADHEESSSSNDGRSSRATAVRTANRHSSARANRRSVHVLGSARLPAVRRWGGQSTKRGTRKPRRRRGGGSRGGGMAAELPWSDDELWALMLLRAEKEPEFLGNSGWGKHVLWKQLAGRRLLSEYNFRRSGRECKDKFAAKKKTAAGTALFENAKAVVAMQAANPVQVPMQAANPVQVPMQEIQEPGEGVVAVQVGFGGAGGAVGVGVQEGGGAVGSGGAAGAGIQEGAGAGGSGGVARVGIEEGDGAGGSGGAAGAGPSYSKKGLLDLNVAVTDEEEE